MTKLIPLTRGFSAIVDNGDFDSLIQHKWYAARQVRRSREEQVYACRHIYCAGKQSIIYMHRAILGAPWRAEVDHVNGNGLDNQRANLRCASHHQNCANYLNLPNSTGFRGVHFRHRRGTFAAQLRVRGRTVWIGSFPSAGAAALAYDDAAIIHHGEFATLNFPDLRLGSVRSSAPRPAAEGSA